MGCIQFGKSYFDLNNVEERDIRRWEKDIGSFAIDFNQVYQKISHEVNAYKKPLIKRVTEQDFSSQFYRIFTETDFYTKQVDGVEMYDAAKVAVQFFLLTSQGMIANKYSYYSDKTYFFYLRCKTREEEDLAQGLTKDSDLKAFVSLLVEVACIGFPRVYFKVKNIDERGLIKEAANHIEDIADFVISDLFTVKGQKVDLLSFNELKERFGSDNYFFSSGYFRAKGIEYLQTLGKK
jgi:hypothetical protein